MYVLTLTKLQSAFFQALLAPFRDKELSKAPARGSKKTQTYIDKRALENRLDTVCGQSTSQRERRCKMSAIATPTAPTVVAMNKQPVTMLETVEHEAAKYRAWGTEMGDFFAAHLEREAQLIRWTSASNPTDFDDRIETYDRDLRERLYDQGYHQGLEVGRRECRCGRCYHDLD